MSQESSAAVTIGADQLRVSATLAGASASVGQRHLQQTDIVHTIVFFFFGAIIMLFICSLSRANMRAEADEERQREDNLRKAQENAIKEAERRRKRLGDAFTKNNLHRTLVSTDIQKKESARYEVKPQTPESEVEEELPVTLQTFGVDETTETDSKDLEAGQLETETTIIHNGPEETKEFVAAVATEDERDEAQVEEKAEAATDVEARGRIDPSTDFEDADGFLLGAVAIKRDGKDFVIPITCAICLDQYEAGDEIVWSGNSVCKHAFHKECILDYLVHHDSEAAPCPCCRQIFLPMK